MIMFNQHHCGHCRVYLANAAARNGNVTVRKLHLPHHKAVQRLNICALTGEQGSRFGIHASDNTNSLKHTAPAPVLNKILF